MSFLAAFDSLLGRDEIGIVFGAGAWEVVVDGEPRYLAFDTEMLGWRCILRVIEGADLNPNKPMIGIEIPAHQPRTAVGAEATLENFRGFVKLRFTARDPKTIRRNCRDHLECAAGLLLAHPAMAILNIVWRLASLIAHRAAEAAAGNRHGLITHDVPPLLVSIIRS